MPGVEKHVREPKSSLWVYEEKGSGINKFWWSSYGLGANERESYNPVISSSPLIDREFWQEGTAQHTLPQDRPLLFDANLLS